MDGVVDEREVAIAKFCFYAGIVIMHKRMDGLNSSKLSLKDKIMALKLTGEELLEWMDGQKDAPVIPDRIIYEWAKGGDGHAQEAKKEKVRRLLTAGSSSA